MKSQSMTKEMAMRLALDRASSHFSVHSDQRLKMMNFYLILFGAILAGFTAAINNNQYWLELILSAALLIITYCFKQLDRRTAQLVKIAEGALAKIERLISETMGMDDFELVKAAEIKNKIPSYRKTFDKLFLTGAALAIFGIGYSTCILLGYVK